MNLEDYILLPLEDVSKIFADKGYAIKEINNNYNVSGDRKLVTNIRIDNDTCVIYYGEFIFNKGGGE